MSASFEATPDWATVPPAPPMPAAFDRSVRSATENRGDRAALRYQLRIVQDMLEDLEEQIPVGRQHTMEKVIAVLRDQIGRGLFRTGPRNGKMLLQLVD